MTTNEQHLIACTLSGGPITRSIFSRGVARKGIERTPLISHGKTG
jgi:hypothetical protein